MGDAITDLRNSLNNPDDPWTQEFALIGYAIVELADLVVAGVPVRPEDK